jgi:hypothetical protein
MDYEAWQLKRRALQDVEKSERSINWTQSRAPIQAAITEQAVRELYDLTATLQDRIQAIEAKRGPGRPPKEAE